MADDAMEIWKREVAIADAAARAEPPEGDPPASRPPPGFPRRPARFAARPSARVQVRFIVPVLLGGGFALLVILAGDYRQMNSATVFLPAVLGACVALISKRSWPEAGAWALVAWLTAVGIAVVLIPFLIFMDFLECWMSWLSNC